jgi:hypothetical protein
VEYVETPRHLLGIAAKRRQPFANGVEWHVQRPDGSTSSQHVLDLKPDLAAVCKWNVLQRSQHILTMPLGKHNMPSTDKNCPLAACAMCGQYRMLAVPSKEDDAPRTIPGHLRHLRISGVQHGDAVPGDIFNDGSFDAGQILDSFDAMSIKMIAVADIRNDRDITEVEAETLAKNAATRRLQDGDADGWVEQHGTGAARTATVIAPNTPPIDVDTIRAGHGDARRRVGSVSDRSIPVADAAGSPLTPDL